MNIPIKRNNKPSKWAQIVLAMKPGDNRKHLTKNEAKSLCFVLRYRGFKAIQRKMLDDSYSVWKFKIDPVLSEVV